ncbi:unnamed protein product [Toxocara canis]|nr:unnamed protein product [Toxocara canis]
MEIWAQRPFESLRQVPYPTAYCLLDEIIAICQNALELHVANIDPVNITATAMIRVVEAMIAATCTNMCSVSSISGHQTISDSHAIPLLNAKDGYCILNRLLHRPCSIHAPTLSASLMQQSSTSCDLTSELDEDSVAWR